MMARVADSPAPRPWTDLPTEPQDVRLVACDMDGTLLRPDGSFPAGFADLLGDLQERGVVFVPASGRQFATLADMFPTGSLPGTRSFIAENGTLVMHEGEIVSTTILDPERVEAGLAAAFDAARTFDAGVVVCGVRGAYVQRDDEPFLAEVRRYYHRLDVVEDVTAVTDDVLKLALFTFGDAAELAAQFLAPLEGAAQVVVSGPHWVDVMSTEADKGRALIALREALGVMREQTAAFGDYLNDLEMQRAAEWSFAVENAHADIKAASAWLAPANTQDAVIVVLRRLLGL